MTPLLRWISSSAADAVGRMLLQLAATALFARWLAPEAFGEAALTAVGMGLLSVLVTAPFEEALSQRKTVRRRHFAAALAVVLLSAAALCVGALLVAALLPGNVIGTDHAPLRAAVYSLILFAEGPAAILTAVCRRHRRFSDIAWANLGGQVLGSLAGIALVLLGFGVIGLLSVRFVSRFATLALLAARSRIRIVPRLTRAPLQDLSGFAGWHLAGRVVESLSEAAYQFLVTAWFGLAAGGYLNMAMRVVEPLRGATGAIGHNIATAFFARAQASPERFRAAVTQTIAQTVLLLLPVFIGLAAAGPTIIAALAGPIWAPAAPLAVLVALAAAAGTVTNFMHSAVAAQGRADIGFISGVIDLIVSCVVLLIGSKLGLIAVGLARLLPYLADGVFISLAARRVFGLPLRLVAAGVFSIAVSNAAMALAVVALAFWSPLSARPGVLLAVQIMVGVLVYAVLVLLRHRPLLQDIRGHLLA